MIVTRAAVDPAHAVVPVRAIGVGVIVVPTRMLARAPAEMPAAVAAPHGLTLRQAADAVFALWLVGVAAILLYQIMALLGLYRLRYLSTAQEISIPELRGPWQLRIATQSTAHGPLTWGLFRPVVLLPFNALTWPHERLAAVLHHEIAHVHRRDTLTQMLAQLVCAFYWPNPLVWLGNPGGRAPRVAADSCRDDAVLAAGIKPSSYADALVALATEFNGYSSGLAMAAPSALAVRVKSVLAPTQSHIGVTIMDVFKIACLGAAAIALIALGRPDLAVAQQAPTAPAGSARVAAKHPNSHPAQSAATAQATTMAAQVDQPHRYSARKRPTGALLSGRKSRRRGVARPTVRTKLRPHYQNLRWS